MSDPAKSRDKMHIYIYARKTENFGILKNKKGFSQFVNFVYASPSAKIWKYANRMLIYDSQQVFGVHMWHITSKHGAWNPSRSLPVAILSQFGVPCADRFGASCLLMLVIICCTKHWHSLSGFCIHILSGFHLRISTVKVLYRKMCRVWKASDMISFKNPVLCPKCTQVPVLD